MLLILDHLVTGKLELLNDSLHNSHTTRGTHWKDNFAVSDLNLNFLALAVSSTAMTQGRLPDTPLLRSVLNNYNPRRSGEIYVVFAPNWFINDFDGLTVAATHGSPWRYDTFVPIIFAGAGLKHQFVDRKVYTVDIAPTLSIFVGAKQPSGTRGNLLREVLQ